jgi:hypothetical protein
VKLSGSQRKSKLLQVLVAYSFVFGFINDAWIVFFMADRRVKERYFNHA